MLGIDPNRVLIVTNSDNAQSNTDASDYIVKRGLTSRKLAFNFGTDNSAMDRGMLTGGAISHYLCQTAPYAGQAFTVAIANYVADNAIEAVILSTYTPCRVSFGGGVYTVSSFAGAASWWNANSSPLSYFDPTPRTRTTINQIVANVAQDWRPNRGNNPNSIIPHGRLGCPDYNNNTIAEVALNASVGPESIYTHAVTNGLVAETQDQTQKQHALTQSLAYSVVTAALQTLAFNWAKQIAMPFVANMGTDYAMNPASNPPLVLPGPLFALCLAVDFNGVNQTNLQNAFTCLAGAWGFNWTSNAGQFGQALLYNGGSAAALSFGEPFSDGIPQPQELFIYVSYYQVPAMLAHFLAYGNDMGSTTCGDPLYTPYKATGVRPPKPFMQPYTI